MHKIQTQAEFSAALQLPVPVLFYFSHNGCRVCHSDLPKVVKIAEKTGIQSFQVDTQLLPEAAGQSLIFSVPAVLLMEGGKEYHRQARIIDFKRLEQKVIALMESIG